MRIRFQFNLNKAIAVMAHIIQQLGVIDKAKLMKLLYIADRESFLRLGRPITGDSQVAMPWGPVPTECLSAIDGERWFGNDYIFRYLQVNDYRVSLREQSDVPGLDEDETRVLQDVLAKYGDIETWELVRQTHQFPEYRQTYVDGTSTPIPYEKILEVYGSEHQFRHGRPVVSQATASHMITPFRGSEDDL